MIDNRKSCIARKEGRKEVRNKVQTNKEEQEQQEQQEPGVDGNEIINSR
jgi:hypothetical protein